MWGGQLLPVASTGMSSYFSKFIPVLLPEKSSLKIWKETDVFSQTSRATAVQKTTGLVGLTAPGARWEPCVWTNPRPWSPPPSGCRHRRRRWSLRARIWTRANVSVNMFACTDREILKCASGGLISTQWIVCWSFTEGSNTAKENQQHQVSGQLCKNHWFSAPSSGPRATIIEVGVLGPVGATPEAVVPGGSSPVAVFVVVIAEPCQRPEGTGVRLPSRVFLRRSDSQSTYPTRPPS